MIRGNWWEVFNEPELNALEEQLNINNQNIKSLSRTTWRRAPSSPKRARNTGPPSPRIHRGSRSRSLRQSEHLVAPPTPARTYSLWNAPRRRLLDARFLGQDPQRSARGAIRRAGERRRSRDREAHRAGQPGRSIYFEIRGQDMLQQILNQTVAADQKALDCNQGAYDAGIGDYISVVEAQDHAEAAQSSAINVGSAARAIRARHRHAAGQGGHRFFHPRKAHDLHAAGHSHRRAFAACWSAGPMLPPPSARWPKPTPPSASATALSSRRSPSPPAADFEVSRSSSTFSTGPAASGPSAPRPRRSSSTAASIAPSCINTTRLQRRSGHLPADRADRLPAGRRCACRPRAFTRSRFSASRRR